MACICIEIKERKRKEKAYHFLRKDKRKLSQKDEKRKQEMEKF